MRINKIKELHEIEIEIKSLEIKIIIERIKEIRRKKMLEKETDNKMEALK